MKTKLLAVVSTGALLLMSGPADAGGASGLAKWLFNLERSGPQVFKFERSGTGLFNLERSGTGLLKSERSFDDLLKSESDLLKSERSLERALLPSAQPRRDIIDLKVSSLYDEATPEILDALKVPELTQQQLEEKITQAVKKAIESAEKEKGSGITFEPLTGKLKVDLSYTTPLGKVKVGEVNIYVVSAVAAAGVFACLNQPGYNECAKAALAKVGSAVAKEMVPESARIPEKTPTILDE
jgi:hypothetical protein